MEGGSLRLLIAPTVILPLMIGVLFTTLFSFSFREIVDTFKDCFSEGDYTDRLYNYHKGLLIVKNLATATMFWSWSVMTMAIILILSNLRTPDRLGPPIAVALLSLLYGFGTKAALFVPMEYSLHKKVLSIKESQV